MRRLVPGVDTAPDRFHRAFTAVLAQIAILVTGLEESIDHGGFLDPTAYDHSSHVVGDLVELLIAATFRSAGKLNCAAT